MDMGFPHLSRLGKLVGDEPNHQQPAGRPRLHLDEVGLRLGLGLGLTLDVSA